MILETSQKVSEAILLINKSVYILKVYSITIHWDKTQMLKKLSSDKINLTKKAVFFLSRVAAHHSLLLIQIIIWAEAQASSL